MPGWALAHAAEAGPDFNRRLETTKAGGSLNAAMRFAA
jgi:hypothetical protein